MWLLDFVSLLLCTRLVVLFDIGSAIDAVFPHIRAIFVRTRDARSLDVLQNLKLIICFRQIETYQTLVGTPHVVNLLFDAEFG